MKIILQENIESLGKIGDIVNVAEGYGRNFLLPRRKAILADDRNLKMLNHQKLLAEHRRSNSLKEAQALAKRIEGLSISIARQAGENNKLYGSVTTMDIEDALRAEKVEVDRRAILLDEPIKNIGKFTVNIKVHSEVSAKLQLFVIQK